jgi:hypothetical protein
VKRLGEIKDKENRKRERQTERERRNGKGVEKPDMFSMANACESHQVETGQWRAELNCGGVGDGAAYQARLNG